MAKKPKPAKDEKFERHSFDIFKALAAINMKDYSYYDRLTEEEKKNFNPFMLVQWLSAPTGSWQTQAFYLSNTNNKVNHHLFNEMVMKHPKLQWLMLCSAGTNKEKIFHKWIYQISKNVSTFSEPAKPDKIYEYFSKIYPNTNESTIQEYTDVYVQQQHKKHYLAKSFPNLKIDEIELLSELITDEEIQKHKENSGEI